MKKTKFFVGLFLLAVSIGGFTSCSSEENTATNPSPAASSATARTPEVVAFQNALIQQIKDEASFLPKALLFQCQT
jgi:hypothetical protein